MTKRTYLLCSLGLLLGLGLSGVQLNAQQANHEGAQH